jgi:hypothetical protein
MISNTEAADILEAAADLYQAEKVQWCAGTWYDNDAIIPPEGQLTACAATAVGLAAGLGLLVPELLEEGCLNRPDLENGDARYRWAYEYTEDNIERYRDTRYLVEERLMALHGVRYLPEFNDMAERFKDNGSTVFKHTKQDVIDLFKEVAKDLRNES